MKFDLKQSEIKRKGELYDQIVAADNKLIAAVEKYNAALAAAYEELYPAVAEFNGVVESARGFADDIGRERREEYDGRSDKWRESEAASGIDGWISEWEGLELEELSVEEPTPCDIDTTHAASFEELQNEAPS